MPESNDTANPTALPSTDGSELGTSAAPSAEPAISPCPPPQIKSLYVFLHGLYVILDRPSRLEVLMPQVAEHTYRAGPFLGETLLLPRPFDRPYYFHAPSGGNHFVSEKSLLTDRRKPDNTCGSSVFHARIVMPVPYDIHYIRLMPLLDSLTGDKSLLVGTTSALLVVLEYQFINPSEVCFEGHPFNALADSQDQRHASLHIFSEEDFAAQPGHKAKGFEAACHLLPDLRGKISLATIPNSKVPKLCYKEILPGTILAEYFSLRDRTEGALTRLGSSLRAGRFPSMDFPSPIGSDVETCVTLVSRLTQSDE